MKTKILLAISLVAALMMSCDSDVDGTSYSPTFKGFQYYTRMSGVYTYNSTVYPEDSLYIKACQDQLGHLINAVNYTWMLVVDTVSSEGFQGKDTLIYKFHTNYDGTDNGDPLGHFLVPATATRGKATVVFEADYHFSGGGQLETIGNNIQSPYLGDYLNTINSSMYGGAKGQLTFQITPKN